MEPRASSRRCHRLTLSALRQNCGWSQRRLAESSGFSLRSIESWEAGDRGLPERTLNRLAAAMSYQPVQVEALRLALDGLGEPETGARKASPVERAADERREAQLRALREGLALAREREAGHLASLQAQQVAREREEADALIAGLLPRSPPERLATCVANEGGVFHRWAFVERACAQSLRELPRDVARGHDWAYLALQCAADPSPAVESRLCGYAWAFVGHAHRAEGDLFRAESSFGWSREFWEEAKAAASLPLEEWRILELEAGLYRDLEEPAVALSLHDLALRAALAAAAATPVLLLSKAETLEGLDDAKLALACLEEAWGQVDAAQSPRLRFLLGWKRADLLSRLGRWREAESVLDEVRSQALDLARAEDLARCLWLQGRCEAGRDKPGRALDGLGQARAQLAERKKVHEPVEIALEIAELHLRRVEPAPARKLAEELGRGERTRRLSEGTRTALARWLEVARSGGEMLPWVQKALAELRRSRPRTRP